MASPSATVVHMGFSHSTCLPARAARMVYSACIEFGRQTITASMALFSAMAS